MTEHAKKHYVTKHELAARTGLSAATIQRLKDQGRIPFFQPAGKGGKLLFPPDAVERALSAVSESSIAPTGTKPLAGPAPRWRQSRN